LNEGDIVVRDGETAEFYTIDFGAVECDAKLNLVFPFRNLTRRTIVNPKRIVGCSCLDFRIEPSSIPPGGVGQLHLSFTAPRIVKDFKVVGAGNVGGCILKIETSGKTEPWITCKELQDGVVDFCGRDNWTAKVESPSSDSVEFDNDGSQLFSGLQVKICENTDKSNSCVLEIRRDADSSIGHVKSPEITLRLRSKDLSRGAEFRLTVRDSTTVQVYPEFIFQRGGRSFLVNLRVQSADNSCFKPICVKSDSEYVSISRIGQETEHSATAEFSVRAEIPLGKTSGYLTVEETEKALEVNHHRFSLRIPYVFINEVQESRID